MGVTFIDGVVTGPTGASASVPFLVDSGAQYTLLASTDWQTIGLRPKRTEVFSLADGTRIERDADADAAGVAVPV